MIVLALLVATTVLCSRRWIEGGKSVVSPIPDSIRRLGIASSIAVFLQILIGAVMRHAEAGLAIARFPLSSADSLLPAYWNLP